MGKTLCPIVPGRRWTDIDRIAREKVLTLFGYYQNMIQPQAMFHLFQDGTLQKLGFQYGVESLPIGEEGKYNPATNEIILSEDTYYALAEDNGRAKFTLAHEIGHGVLHGAYLQEALAGRASREQYKRSQIPAYADPECQANKFASYFLMPAPLFGRCIQDGYTISQIAVLFGVSKQAAEIRYKDFQKPKASNF